MADGWVSHLMKDTFEKFAAPERGRFGDNEQAPRVTGASNLCELDLFLRNDNPTKKAIAVSRHAMTSFADWSWLPRSLIEYELIGVAEGVTRVRVILPRPLAAEKGLL